MRSPYRSDQDALTGRLVALIAELEALRGRTSELRDVEKELADVEHEIGRVREQLARVAPTRLPLLERITLASPCSEDWNGMTGDERARLCKTCDKHVYNIAAMTAEQAEDFLRGVGSDACLRLYRRPDGTVLTADCPVGARRKRRRRAVASVAFGGLLAGGALVSALRARAPIAPPPVGQMVAGFTADDRPPSPDASSGPVPMGVIEPRPPPAGMPPRRRPADQIEAEVAHVRRLLDTRARTTDVTKRRAVETEIKGSSERIRQLSQEL